MNASTLLTFDRCSTTSLLALSDILSCAGRQRVLGAPHLQVQSRQHRPSRSLLRHSSISLLTSPVLPAKMPSCLQDEDAARISKLTAETCDLTAELSASKKEAKDAKEREIVELTRGFEKQLQDHDKQAKADASRKVQQVSQGSTSCLSCLVRRRPIKPPSLLHLAALCHIRQDILCTSRQNN